MIVVLLAIIGTPGIASSYRRIVHRTDGDHMNQRVVVFAEYGKKGLVSEGEDVLDATNEAGIGISAVCGGRGLCGKCRILVKDGAENLEPVSPTEMMSLSDEELSRGYRLACCARVIRNGTVHIEVPPESSIEQQRLLVAGIETAVSLSPCVRKCVLRLTPPSLEDIKSDAEVLLDALAKQVKLDVSKISHSALIQLPFAIRNGDWVVTVTLYENREIIRVEPGNNMNGPYGLAVDIGSTKLAAYLLNLNEGRVVATASLMNPQIPFGEDIISRISYASKNEMNLRKLQGVTAAAVNKLLRDTCKEAGISTTDVCDLAVVGNTVMHHIFLGINPQFVALSPYPPVIRTSMVVHAKEIGLSTNAGARIYLPPIIGGFVGADAVADVLATQICGGESPALMIDIGTNTEVVIGDETRLIACSCASGPALEGGGVEHGMRAETGAIERVYIDPRNLEPGYRTVGDAPPRGICGSGILDAISSMLKSGIIDENGRINSKLNTQRIRVRNEAPEYVLVWKGDTTEGNEITVSQRDIQQIQLAKAAIYSAVSILMVHLGIEARDIQQLFLAGAFGTYVDPQSALMLGMYPEILLNRIRFVGNAAGSGARMALLSIEIRAKAQQIAKQIEYIELAADRNFHQEFAKALFLPHKDRARFPTVSQLLAKRLKSW